MFLKKYFCYLPFLATGLLSASVLPAQELPDTVRTYPLSGVEVKASVPSPFSSNAPLQIFPSGVLSKTGAMQVADAVKFFSGVQVKDYGGIGGLKTISIRSLSANYSGVLYDGVPVFDYQTGQIDLSRFSLDNVLSLVLQTGETGDLLQPAYERSCAGALNIVTQNQWKNPEKKNELQANFKTGSFGLVNPSLYVGRMLNNTFSARFFGEYLQSNGNYPFSQIYGFSDSTLRKKRKNSDMEFYKFESNICGNFPNGGQLSGKAYYYLSDRGIPGSVLYHNDYSGERVKDQTAFLQASYSQHVTQVVDFRTSAKFNFSAIDYTDLKYRDEKDEKFYYQRQYFLNMTVRYRISKQLSVSWANDGIYGNFENNFSGVFHSRINYLSALTGKYEHPVFILTGSLLHNFTDDENKAGSAFRNRSHWSPYLGLSVKPMENIPVRIRAYYKNTYRFPTFGDLYLSPVPTLNLQPENANQYNLGLTFSASLGECISLFSFSGDVYQIQVENKLVALPRGSMFIWSVQNFGRTETRGLDLNLKVQAQLQSGFSAELSGTYTFQKVLDKTDETNPSYNQQLAYTPRHSATAYLLLETPWLDVNYTFIYCGRRNYMGMNRPEYWMKPYADQGAHLRKTIRWQDYSLVFTAECLNLFDRQYEVVRSYPMPGRSFRLGVKFIY
ncbi:MAG: TonB-dependent receptor plug domain-containing protein [Dysgonamonadaceae bacterium]|jgi:outer membrane cobalamin receptor|nr:TonB-dependent receptor plug domain-containing protein [Dysgonamonadaceae bacterium]